MKIPYSMTSFQKVNNVTTVVCKKVLFCHDEKKPKHTQSAPKARAESPGRAACFAALSRIREAEEVFDVMSQTTPAYGTIRLFYYSFNRRLYADYVRFSFK